MRAIPEPDWKTLRALKTRALNDACARMLDAVAQIVQNRDGREHEAYLELWELLQHHDAWIAAMVDDFKRSTAVDKLAAWQRHGLVSEREVAGVTEETQAAVKTMNQNARSPHTAADGGTAVVCRSVVQSTVQGGSAPAVERGR
jgi:hypothetical protein